MKKVLASLCALSAVLFGYSESVESPVWAAFSVNCPANGDTYVGIVSTRDVVFKGVVRKIDVKSSLIAPSTSPNWVINQFVYDGDVQLEHFYLKFTSGNLEGAWFDIVANSENGVEISISSTELSLVSVNDTFEIIPHWTFDTLFPDGGGLTKSTGRVSKAGASVIWKFTNFGENGVECPIGANNAYSKSYYYRERGDDIGWRDGNGNSADLDVVEPNTFFVVRQPSDSSADVNFSGVVPMCATSFEVFAGGDGENAQNQDNYLVVPSVVDIKLSDLTECLVDSGAFKVSDGRVNAAEDTLFYYSNDSGELNRLPSNSYYFRNRGTTCCWLDSGKENADEDVLKAGAGIIIQKKPQGAPEISRCVFYPPYTLTK